MTGWTKQSAEAAVKARKNNNAIRKQQKIDDYNANPTKCQVCDNYLTYEQNVGKIKFCSIGCANHYRKRDATSRKKTSTSIKNIAFEKRKARPPMICRFCGISFTTLISPSRTKICGSDDCKVLQNELKVISLSEGAKKGRQTAKDRGTFSGWKKRTKEPSYPEQYFIDLFNNENINGFEREHNVGRWFIDFAFLDKKIAIEIDGKQHQHRKHLDEEKDNFLRENGWTVFRIEWFNPINEKNRNKLYPKIKLMKEILGV